MPTYTIWNQTNKANDQVRVRVYTNTLWEDWRMGRKKPDPHHSNFTIDNNAMNLYNDHRDNVVFAVTWVNNTDVPVVTKSHSKPHNTTPSDWQQANIRVNIGATGDKLTIEIKN